MNEIIKEIVDKGYSITFRQSRLTDVECFVSNGRFHDLYRVVEGALNAEAMLFRALSTIKRYEREEASEPNVRVA